MPKNLVQIKGQCAQIKDFFNNFIEVSPALHHYNLNRQAES